MTEKEKARRKRPVGWEQACMIIISIYRSCAYARADKTGEQGRNYVMLRENADYRFSVKYVPA